MHITINSTCFKPGTSNSWETILNKTLTQHDAVGLFTTKGLAHLDKILQYQSVHTILLMHASIAIADLNRMALMRQLVYQHSTKWCTDQDERGGKEGEQQEQEQEEETE